MTETIYKVCRKKECWGKKKPTERQKENRDWDVEKSFGQPWACCQALFPNSIHARGESKAHCYWTLHTCCYTLAVLSSPIQHSTVPITDGLWVSYSAPRLEGLVESLGGVPVSTTFRGREREREEIEKSWNSESSLKLWFLEMFTCATLSSLLRSWLTWLERRL